MNREEAVNVVEEKKTLRKQVIARRNAMDSAERARKSSEICKEIIAQLESCCEQRIRRLDLQEQGPDQPESQGRSLSQPESQGRGLNRLGSQMRRPSQFDSQGEALPFTVGLFSALGSEVDLRDVVRHARLRQWNVALPVMVTQSETPGYAMIFVEVDYDSALAREEGFMAKPAKNINPEMFDFRRFPFVDPKHLDALVVPLVAFDDQGGRLGYGGGNYDRYLPQLRDDCWISGVAFDEQRVGRVPRADFDLAIPQVIHA